VSAAATLPIEKKKVVMAGPVLAIQFGPTPETLLEDSSVGPTWIPGTSPGMTIYIFLIL
jgi:hypothetical protein